MTSGTQNTIIKNLASDGCYFLAICELGERIAHRPVDVVETAVVAIKSEWVTSAFKVMHPDKLLKSAVFLRRLLSAESAGLPVQHNLQPCL